MSTFLGAPELQLVWALITFFTVVWIVIFILFVLSFVEKKK